MIPVIIGAAVGLAGAALLSGDDKKQPETEKRQVSEDYIMQQLNRAGKNFSAIQQTNFPAVQQSDENTIQYFREQHDKKHNDYELEKAFSNIEKKIAQPNRNNKAIKKKLFAIENWFKQQRNATAMRRIAACYKKIGEHKAAEWCYQKALEYES